MGYHAKIPRFNDLTINRKMLVIIMVGSVGAFFLLWGAFVTFEIISFRDHVLRDLQIFADVTGYNCSAALIFDDQADAEKTLVGLRAKENVTCARVFLEDGKALASYVRPGENRALLPAKPGKEGHYFKDGSLFLFKGIRVGDRRIGTIYLESHLRELRSTIWRSLLIGGLILIVISLLSLLLSSRLRKIISSPIMELTETAKAITRDKNYTGRPVKRSGDEVGVLVDAFNDMLANIELRDAALLEEKRKVQKAAQKARESEGALQKAHDELELRVARRTAALSEANEQLGRQIEERKRAEEQIRLSLKEKKVLLAEIHHRVKNNLQVVSSLLGMTRSRTDNPEAVELLSRAQSRVFTMALIHSQLYENDRFIDIDMGKHAQQLIFHLTQIYGKEKVITPVIKASGIALSLTYAVPCAMVLNELISNAFKHAYQDGEEGTIEVTMERSPDDKFSLIVRDYGVGLPEEADIDETVCLGLKLAKNLVIRQLRGHFQIRRDNGTEVLVDFQVLGEE